MYSLEPEPVKGKRSGSSAASRYLSSILEHSLLIPVPYWTESKPPPTAYRILFIDFNGLGTRPFSADPLENPMPNYGLFGGKTPSTHSYIVFWLRIVPFTSLACF